jgi:hypothetical protein
LELLTGLDAWRGISEEFRAQHAELTATVRLSRGTPEDVVAARAALEDVRGWGDPYERVYVDSLLGLSRWR